MRTLFAAVALIAAAVGLSAAAQAQQKAPVYRYCLLEGSFTNPMTLCRFNTLAQCIASKVSHTDTCIINPQLTQKK